MSRERCDNCRTSFDCKTLNTALKVLDAHQAEIDDPELMARYRAISKLLAEGGWNYPEGGTPCRFARMPSEVRQLTTELVQIWQRSHFRNAGAEASAYHAEVRPD